MGKPDLNDLQRRLVRHALGLPNRRNCSYRNYFVSHPSGEAYNAWLGLERRGLAVAGQPMRSGNVPFALTMVGAEAALNAGERLCMEDFPDQSPPMTQTADQAPAVVGGGASRNMG